MDESGSSPPTAACPEDLERIRELADAVRREREERTRMDAVCEETRSLVHALNNALSIITTFAAALGDEVDAGSPLRESVDEITRAAKRAGNLTRKLGDLQRRATKGDAKQGPQGQGRA